jgi:cytochrome c
MTAQEFRINKVLGAILGTLLFLQALHIIDGAFQPSRPGEPRSEVTNAPEPGKEAGPASSAQLNSLLATASAERGAQIAKQCGVCHNFEEGQGAKIGPDLYGVVDRPVASVPGFNYTPALKKKGGKWTFAALDKWIENPRADVPGTAMTFAGLSNQKQRADVIAYLDSLSKNPVPLPKAQ